MTIRKTPSQIFEGDGEEFSLSQRERAGVREKTAQLASRSRFNATRKS
jgi:hypothetical protein